MSNKFQLILTITETIFYIVTGLIALLTFLIARKTVLQPIKTEVFKKQIDIATEIMALFNGKNEIAIRNAFGFDLMEKANIFHMLDTYANFFFDVKVDESKRPYCKDICSSAIVSCDYLEQHCERIVSPVEQRVYDYCPEKKSKEEQWKDYTHNIILQPKKTLCMLDRLDEIMKSPFLPSKAVQLLSEIKETVHKNIVILGDVLTRESQQLPIFYPDLDSMNTAEISWIAQKYNDEFIPLEKSCCDLTAYLREYFHVESIMN